MGLQPVQRAKQVTLRDVTDELGNTETLRIRKGSTVPYVGRDSLGNPETYRLSAHRPVVCTTRFAEHPEPLIQRAFYVDADRMLVIEAGTVGYKAGLWTPFFLSMELYYAVVEHAISEGLTRTAQESGGWPQWFLEEQKSGSIVY